MRVGIDADAALALRLHNREVLSAFYAKRDPSRLGGVDQLLSAFTVAQLREAMHGKYGEAPSLRDVAVDGDGDGAQGQERKDSRGGAEQNSMGLGAGPPPMQNMARDSNRALSFVAEEDASHTESGEAEQEAKPAPGAEPSANARPEPDAKTKKVKPQGKSPWTKMIDPSSGHPYWYNAATKRSTWEPPAEEAKPPSLPPLPPQPPPQSFWKQCTDEATGRTYFFNARTQQSSWTRPADFQDEGGSSDGGGADAGGGGDGRADSNPGTATAPSSPPQQSTAPPTAGSEATRSAKKVMRKKKGKRKSVKAVSFVPSTEPSSNAGQRVSRRATAFEAADGGGLLATVSAGETAGEAAAAAVTSKGGARPATQETDDAEDVTRAAREVARAIEGITRHASDGGGGDSGGDSTAPEDTRKSNVRALARFFAKHDRTKLQPPTGGGAGAGQGQLGQLHQILDASPDMVTLERMLQQKYGEAPSLTPEAGHQGTAAAPGPHSPRKVRKGKAKPASGDTAEDASERKNSMRRKKSARRKKSTRPTVI